MQLFMDHIVSSLHLLKERIFFFMCILNLATQFLSLVCVFFPHLLNFSSKLFSQNLFCFFLFYRGRSLSLIFVVHKGSYCSSYGQLPLFFIKLNCFMFPWFFFFFFFFSCLLSLYSLFELSLSICDKKGGEINEMQESCLFCLGGVEIVFERGRIFFMYLTQKESQNLFLFLYSASYFCLHVFLSTHALMCSFECFQERQVHSDQDLLPLLATSRLGVLDWDL